MTTETQKPTLGLLEREVERDRIRAVVASAASGHGGLLLIDGPAGIGKTELLEVACSAATRAGFDQLRARGSELEHELAYGLVRQLFERRLLGSRTGRRNSLRRESVGAAATVLWPRTGHARRADAVSSLEVAHALYWLCANMAERQPLVLAIDDAQWVDSPSLHFLEYLARRIGDLPLLIVVTRRTSEQGAYTPAFLRLASESHVTCLAPSPLSEGAVTDLVRDRFGSHADPSFCHACHEATGGNPFLVRELLATAYTTDVPPTGAGAARLFTATPAAVTRSIELRLAALPHEAAALARAVAVLGGNAQIRHASGVANLPPLAAARGADELVAAAILRPGRPLDFVHPLVRAAVYAGQAPTDRAEAHLRAARLLAHDQAEPGRVGVHLMSTEPSADQWTVEALISAGRAALMQGVPRTAVGYLTRALAEPPAATLRSDVLRELGSAEQRVGDPGAIGHLREALVLSQDTAATAATARALALGLLWSDRIGEAEEILDPTLRALAERDAEQAIQLEAEVLSAARLSLSAGLWAAERVERWRGRLAGTTPGERLMLANLATQTSLGDFAAHEAAAFAEAAAGDGRLLAEQTADAMPFYQIVYVLASADRVDRAERLVGQADADARARGSVLGVILASLFGSYTALARGEVIEAEARVALALDLASQLESPVFHLPPCVASLVDVLVERARLDEAERALEAHGMSGELPDSVPFRILLYSRGMLRLAQGRCEQAAGDLLELGRRQAKWRALNPHLIAHDAAAALALAGLHDAESAVALAEQAVVRARRWGTGRAIGRALRARALVGQHTERIPLLQEASAALADSPARLDHARVLVDLGGALRRGNRRSEAAAALRRGLEMASSGGGLAVAANAREELHSLGLRPRRAALTGVNALSGSERRVVDLAAKGRTNPEIAQTLYVTVRTVEVHLTHAYQKLGIQSRAQLAAALVR